MSPLLSGAGVAGAVAAAVGVIVGTAASIAVTTVAGYVVAVALDDAISWCFLLVGFSLTFVAIVAVSNCIK